MTEYMIVLVLIIVILLVGVIAYKSREKEETPRAKVGFSERTKAIQRARKNATPKPHFIRMNGAKPFSKFSMSPKDYGEYLYRRGVKKWGRNK